MGFSLNVLSVVIIKKNEFRSTNVMSHSRDLFKTAQIDTEEQSSTLKDNQ